MSWRTNWFSLNCQEAEVLPKINGIVFRPPKFMPPEKLVILTDGTCGSTVRMPIQIFHAAPFYRFLLTSACF